MKTLFFALLLFLSLKAMWCALPESETFDPLLTEGIKAVFALEPLVSAVHQVTLEQLETIKDHHTRRVEQYQRFKSFVDLSKNNDSLRTQRFYENAASFLLRNIREASPFAHLVWLWSDAYFFEEARVQESIGFTYPLISHSGTLSNADLKDESSILESFAKLRHSRIIMYTPNLNQFVSNPYRLPTCVTFAASPSVFHKYHMFSLVQDARESSVAFYLREDYLAEYRRNHTGSEFMSTVQLDTSQRTSQENNALIKRELLLDILVPLSRISPIIVFPELDNTVFARRLKPMRKMLCSLASSHPDLITEADVENLLGGLEAVDSRAIAHKVGEIFKMWCHDLKFHYHGQDSTLFDRNLAQSFSTDYMLLFTVVDLLSRNNLDEQFDVQNFRLSYQTKTSVFIISPPGEELLGNEFCVSQQHLNETDPAIPCQKFILRDRKVTNWWAEKGTLMNVHFYVNQTFWSEYFVSHPQTTNFLLQTDFYGEDEKNAEEIAARPRQTVHIDYTEQLQQIIPPKIPNTVIGNREEVHEPNSSQLNQKSNQHPGENAGKKASEKTYLKRNENSRIAWLWIGFVVIIVALFLALCLALLAYKTKYFKKVNVEDDAHSDQDIP